MMSGHSNNRWRQLVFDKDGKRYADGSMRRLNMKFPSLQRLYLDVNSAWPGRWAIKVCQSLPQLLDAKVLRLACFLAVLAYAC